jgi:peptidoglycan/LPS O-acetylase OafA/YrhL
VGSGCATWVSPGGPVTRLDEYFVESCRYEIPATSPLDVAIRPEDPTPHNSGRLGRLTGMRFFAALAVVLCHVGYQFTNTSSVNVAESYGYIGVSFFFVLSGLVLTWSYSGQSAHRFVWRRLCRIWPLQCLVVLFAFTALASQEKATGTAGHLLQVVLLQAWSPRQKIYFGGNGVSWSLSCELFFYLLFPLVIRPLRRLSTRRLLATAAGTVALMAIAPAVALSHGVSAPMYYWLFFVFPPYRFGEFFLGMILARSVQLGLRMPRPHLTQTAACCCLAGVVYALTRYTVSTGSDVSRPYVALLVLPFLLILILGAVTLDVSCVPSWLGAQPMLRLGEWSFALYLVHKPIFLLTEQWNWWNQATGAFGDVAGFCGFCVLVVGTAALLYYGVERPLERALRRAPEHFARLPVMASELVSRFGSVVRSDATSAVNSEYGGELPPRRRGDGVVVFSEDAEERLDIYIPFEWEMERQVGPY